MTTGDYSTFYAASTGAGAALIGLLFVAVSIAPEQTVQATAPWERRAAASSAFTALVSALFVSFGALLPDSNMGGVVVVMSAGSLLATLGLAAQLLGARDTEITKARRAVLLRVGVGVYGFEFASGVRLLRHAGSAAAMQAVADIVLGIYGLGLARAWELLGGQRFSLIGLVTARRTTRDVATGASIGGEPPHG